MYNIKNGREGGKPQQCTRITESSNFSKKKTKSGKTSFFKSFKYSIENQQHCTNNELCGMWLNKEFFGLKKKQFDCYL